MHNETITISKCCTAKVIPYHDDQKDKFMCSRCSFACEITKVCMYCFGTKKVEEMIYEDHFIEKKCLCVIQ